MKKRIPVLLLLGALVGALPVQAQQEPPQLIIQPNDVGAIAQQFIALLADQDFGTALQNYDSTVRTSLTPASIQQNWEDIVAENGAFQQQVGVRTVPLDESGGSYVAVVTVEFENATRDLFVTFTGTNQIVSFSAAESQ